MSRGPSLPVFFGSASVSSSSVSSLIKYTSGVSFTFDLLCSGPRDEDYATVLPLYQILLCATLLKLLDT